MFITNIRAGKYIDAELFLFEAILPPVRRYLILFLLFLLPIQVSWAVVANYCDRHQETAVLHLGHHEDERHVSPDVSDDGQLPASESSAGQCHDHLSGFIALLLNESSVSISAMSLLQLHGIEPSFATLPPSQPERPNWSALA